jgi:hypothetical protein
MVSKLEDILQLLDMCLFSSLEHMSKIPKTCWNYGNKGFENLLDCEDKVDQHVATFETCWEIIQNYDCKDGN